MAVASGTARLAGNRIHALRLGCEEAAEDDRDERDVPAVVDSQARAGDKRSGEPAARAGSAAATACGNRPRPGAGGVRPAGEKVGGPSVRPYQPAGSGASLATRTTSPTRASPVPPEPVHVLEAHRAASVHGDLRFRDAGKLHGSRVADEHAAAGAEPDERRDVRGGARFWRSG